MEKVTQGQAFAIVNLVENCAKTRDRDVRMAIISELIGRKVGSTIDVYKAEWERIRNVAYPGFHDGDWSISKEMDTKIKSIIRKLQKDSGQEDLFDN